MGLEMQGAQVVTYDATRVVWRWEGTAGRAAPTPETWGEPVATTFTMPAGIPVYLDANLQWQFPEATIRFWIESPDGRVCQSGGTVGHYDNDRAACGLAAGPANETETWTVAVQSVSSFGEAPFTLTLEIALPSWLDDPPPAAAIHTTGARALPDSAWPWPLPAFAVHEIPAVAFEPTLGIADDGDVYYVAVVQGETIVPQVWRSADAGASWTDVSPTIAGSQRDPDANGGDPYLHVDPVTGRVFVMDLPSFACTLVAFSSDQGATWTHNPLACGSTPTDHMNIWTGIPPAGTPTVGYPRVVYLCYNDLEGGLWCTRSLNGGLNFLPATLVAMDEGGTPFVWNPVAPCGYVEFGHGASSPVDGTAYVPRISCDTLLIHVSRDGGAMWEEIVVDDATGVIDDIIDQDEATVAVDAGGNVYYMWLDPDRLPRLTVSTDKGRTWSDPVVVSAPGINATRFPAITAGDEGRIAFMYYGAADPDHGRWDAYVGVVLDALASEPVIATAPASDPLDPLRVGRCVGRCGGIGDFMDIQSDPITGSIWVALVDGCTPDACSPHGPRISTDPGTAIASGQVAGPTLREEGST